MEITHENVEFVCKWDPRVSSLVSGFDSYWNCVIVSITFYILSIGAAVRMEWFGCSVDVVTHSFLIYIDSIMFLRHHSDSLVAVAGTVLSCRQHITSIIPDAHTMIEQRIFSLLLVCSLFPRAHSACVSMCPCVCVNLITWFALKFHEHARLIDLWNVWFLLTSINIVEPV